MKRFYLIGVSLLLLFAMLLTGCDIGSGEKSTTTETEAESVDEFANRTKIIENGKALYTLVYPGSASTVVMKTVNRFVDAIEEATGVRLKTQSAASRRNTGKSADKKEILFGQTDSEETQTVLEGLFSDQYAIQEVGNKLVIVAYDDNKLVIGAKYYIDNLIEKNVVKDADGNVTLYAETYTYPSAKSATELTIGGYFIGDFSIVYDADEPKYYSIAETLVDIIKESTGKTLKIYTDTETKTGDCEFLLGETNRMLSRNLYDSRPKLLNYSVVIEGSQVQVLSGGLYSTYACVKEMQNTFFADNTAHIKEGTYMETSLSSGTVEKTSGTDLRIMTSNILAGIWGEDYYTDYFIPDVALRAEIYVAALAKYQPDIIGVQETDAKWVTYLPKYLKKLKDDYGIEYTWLFNSWDDGKVNLTSILYRSDKYEVTASGKQEFSYWKASKYNYHLRVVTWAKFKPLSGSTQEVILANTHWAWESEEESRTCSEEEAVLINQLKTQYSGIPIFCTGDFNSKSDSDDVTLFKTTTGVEETMLQAKESGTRINGCGGTGRVGVERADGENYIDHIFAYGNYDVLRYETIRGDSLMWLTDHALQYADIQFH